MEPNAQPRFGEKTPGLKQHWLHRYRALLDLAPDMIFIVDRAGWILESNAQCARFFQIDHTRTSRTHLRDILAPEQWRVAHEQIAAVFQRDYQDRPHEYVLRSPRGEERIVEVRVARIPETEDSHDGIICYARDVTERKQAEAALRRSRDELQIILQSVADAIVVQAPDGRIVLVNEAARRIFGITPPMPLRTPEELFHQIRMRDEQGRTLTIDDLPAQRLRHGQSSEPRLIELVFPDGRQSCVITRASPVFQDGRVGYYLSVFQDVTAIREADQQRHLSEDKNRAILDAIPDLVLVLDRSGRVLDVRGAPCQQYRDWKGQWLRHRLSPRAVELFEARLARAFETGSMQVFEFEREGDDEHQIFEARLIRALPDEVIALVRDVTETREMQARMLRADRMASLGALAASVAHEINNPLTYLLGTLEGIATQLPRSLAACRADSLAKPFCESTLADQVRDQLAKATEAVHRLRVIAKDLKTFSRAEEERHELVNVLEVLETAIGMAWNEIRHRAQLIRDFGAVPPVMGNPARLGQVFLNLLLNAAQAIPEGHVRDHRITVTAGTGAQGEVVISIQDTGVGITPENMPKLFRPFFTTKPASIGTGLGLAISKNIVESLHGSIRVESTPAKGSSFIVTLPPAPVSPREEATQTLLGAEAVLTQKKILVVDDEPAIIEVISLMLPECEVEGTTRAADALERVAEKDYDLILCDLMMPDMSGIEFYECLKHTRREAIARRVVFMTGGAFTESARHFLKNIPNPCIEKPFELTPFRKQIASLLNGYRQSEIRDARGDGGAPESPGQSPR